jgi:hypothetical protein
MNLRKITKTRFLILGLILFTMNVFAVEEADNTTTEGSIINTNTTFSNEKKDDTPLVFFKSKKEDHVKDDGTASSLKKDDGTALSTKKDDGTTVSTKKDDGTTVSTKKNGAQNIEPIQEKEEKIDDFYTTTEEEGLNIEKSETKNDSRFKKTIPSWLKDDGLYRDNITIWGGMGKHLFGYEDYRYAGDDKGAYLDAQSFNLGVEYYKTGFGDYLPALKDIKVGFNIAFQKRDAFTSKTLTAMQSIPEKIVPNDQKYTNPEAWVNLGFFVGMDNKWYGIDLGLTINLNPYYEKERLMINGTREPINKWYWGDAYIIPNFYFRLGKEDSAHFVFSVLREDYDLKYGAISVYVSLPLHKYFGVDIGGYLYQTDSIFIAPKITIAGFTAKFKVGTILNYQDSVFTKVAIFDSLFGNLALSYEW